MSSYFGDVPGNMAKALKGQGGKSPLSFFPFSSSPCLFVYFDFTYYRQEEEEEAPRKTKQNR